MAIFKGAGVAIATPFNEDTTVNYDKLAELINWQIEEGTDAIIICGTTGESATMSEAEHSRVIKFCVDTVAGRVPVVAGTGSNCTKTAIELSRQAEADGADGLLLVTPYYNKATQKGLIAHYKAIAESVSLPIILYNVPSRTGCNILPETVAYMCKNIKNIVAIKEATGNISQIAKVKHLCGDDIDLYSGNDDQVVPIMSLGGIGVISVLSNVAPKKTHEMCQAFLDGDVKKACEIQLKALPLVEALFCEVNPIPVKAALNMMGREAGPLRAPLTEMEEANKARLRQALIDFGVELA